jgi:hypothetical protein
MAEKKSNGREEKKSAAYELGGTVLLGLVVLTGVEYAFGVRGLSVVALSIVALIKAGLILNYFMHVSRLWAEEEEH